MTGEITGLAADPFAGWAKANGYDNEFARDLDYEALRAAFAAGAAAASQGAQIDPAKLELIADWFDQDDAVKGRTGNSEVQADLRRWAKAVRAGLEA